MIRYRLVCDRGHDFDGWFRDSLAFESQAQEKQLFCPTCHSAGISRAPMAPNIRPSRSAETRCSPAENSAEVMRSAIRQVHEHLKNTADYVGDRFADEARKIHFHEADARDIYGEASSKEAEDLKEEGVEFCVLPKLPEKQN